MINLLQIIIAVEEVKRDNFILIYHQFSYQEMYAFSWVLHFAVR